MSNLSLNSQHHETANKSFLPPFFDLGIHDSTSSWCSFLVSISVLSFFEACTCSDLSLSSDFYSTLLFFSEKNSLIFPHRVHLEGGGVDFINSNSSNSLLNMSKEKAINDISPVNSKSIYVLPN